MYISQFVDSFPVTEENVTVVSRDLADITETTDIDTEGLTIVATLLETITNVNSSSPQV